MGFDLDGSTFVTDKCCRALNSKPICDGLRQFKKT